MGCLILAGALENLLGVKSNVHAYPEGPAIPRLWGSTLILWELSSCRPVAFLSSTAFNDHRTASGFAAAARALARADVRTLVVFGAGKSAPAAVRYVCHACPSIERVVLVGRTHARADALAARLQAEPGLRRCEFRSDMNAEQAARAADVIVTVTTSDTSVFPGDAVRGGTFVVLAGANRPTAREADDALVRRATIYVDALDGALEKAGDLALAARSGALDPAGLAGEVGRVLSGAPVSMRPGTDVLVFKSMGLAVQDLVLASAILDAARRRGLGVEIDLDTGERTLHSV